MGDVSFLCSSSEPAVWRQRARKPEALLLAPPFRAASFAPGWDVNKRKRSEETRRLRERPSARRAVRRRPPRQHRTATPGSVARTAPRPFGSARRAKAPRTRRKRAGGTACPRDSAEGQARHRVAAQLAEPRNSGRRDRRLLGFLRRSKQRRGSPRMSFNSRPILLSRASAFMSLLLRARPVPSPLRQLSRSVLRTIQTDLKEC